MLVRTGAGEQELHPAGIDEDHRGDLEQLQSDRAHVGAGQFGALQTDTADRLDESVGQRRQQQTELVRPPVVTGGAVGEQIQLLLLR